MGSCTIILLGNIVFSMLVSCYSFSDMGSNKVGEGWFFHRKSQIGEWFVIYWNVVNFTKATVYH